MKAKASPPKTPAGRYRFEVTLQRDARGLSLRESAFFDLAKSDSKPFSRAVEAGSDLESPNTFVFDLEKSEGGLAALAAMFLHSYDAGTGALAPFKFVRGLGGKGSPVFSLHENVRKDHASWSQFILGCATKERSLGDPASPRILEKNIVHRDRSSRAANPGFEVALGSDWEFCRLTVRLREGDGKVRLVTPAEYAALADELLPPPEPPLSLRIYSPGDGFLCVRVPGTAKLLRERGLLPLSHAAAAQLHLRFAQPRHFCLFAFGAELEVQSYVPHANLPPGQARERLVVPGDLEPGMGALVFDGTGGAESFLLLVSREPLTAAAATAAGKAVRRLARQSGPLRLPDPAAAFAVDEVLPATRALLLSSARPLSNPLDRFLAGIRAEFAGPFAEFHFLSVHRHDPPRAARPRPRP